MFEGGGTPFILRLVIFKEDSNIYISKGLPDDISAFVMKNTAISFWQFRNANFSEQVIYILHKQEKNLQMNLYQSFHPNIMLVP